MFDVNLVLGLAIGALVATVAVFLSLAGGRRRLAEQLSAAQAALSAAESAKAVAESRAGDLSGKVGQLECAQQRLMDENLRLVAERERVSTTLEKVNQDLARESAAAAQLRLLLEERLQLHAKLEGDHRVASAERENLGRRVAELEQKTREADEENRRQAAAIAELTARATGVETERKGLLERLAAQEKWFAEQTKAFEEKVVNMTNRLLEEKSQKFTEVNRKEIDAVVAPFKEQLKDFRERVDHIYSADTRDRGQLVEQVAQLARLNQTVSQKAEELTKALTISTKATGDWGEMILEKILEDSGLREGKEYVLQHTVTAAEEDALQRPDGVVFLPEKRQVVIDSKVSNKAWTEYCAATDDEERAAKLEAHLLSLRAHIRGLSARDYPSSPDLQTVDFVLMFVPVEAALLTALAQDGALYTDAYRSKIILVTPSTLMAVLKLIEGMWAFQKRKESADKIAEAGRKLCDKLTVFLNTFVEIGSAIERAHGTFEKARGQLVDGRGNVVKLAKQMVDLGVRLSPGRAMPAELVELAGDDEGEDDELEAMPVTAGKGVDGPGAGTAA